MLRKLAATLFIFFIALFSLAAEARTQLDLGFSFAASPPPPPPATVVMAAPPGYSNCYMTPGGWMGGVWVPPHQECEYPNQGPGGTAMWVSGYWGCLSVGPRGDCGRWRWYSHRWARGHEVAYYDHHHDRHHRNYR